MNVERRRSLSGPSLEEQRPKRITVDRDIPQRLRDHRGQENGLPGEKVQLAEEARSAMTDDLVPGRIEYRHLPLDDRDEGISAVAHAGNSTSPTRPVHSSPSRASVASWDADKSGLNDVDTG